MRIQLLGLAFFFVCSVTCCWDLCANNVGELRISLNNPSSFDRSGEPTTCGVPLQRGFTPNTDQLGLLDPQNVLTPLQLTVLERHADDTPRWVLLDFDAYLPANETVVYRLIRGRSANIWPGELDCQLRDGVATVETGVARFRVDTQHFQLFDSVQVRGVELLEADRQIRGILLEDDQATRSAASVVIAEAKFENMGPLRVVLCVRGKFQRGEALLANFTCRMHFYAGKSEVRVMLTLHNPRAHDHPGNIWELGSGGSLFLEDLSIVLALQPDPTREALTSNLSGNYHGSSVRLYQDSSGGVNWRSVNHIDKDYQIAESFRGYRIHVADELVAEGNRARGWLLASGDSGGVAVAIREFWQNFPKVLDFDAGRLRVGLWPREYAGTHEILGGEQKTHEMLFVFHGPGTPADDVEQRLAAFIQPLYAIPDPQAVFDSGTFGPTATLDRQRYAQLEATCDAAVSARGGRLDTIQSQWEKIDEFGWRHFGDTFADNERAPGQMVHDHPEHHMGNAPISHYVNEYDVISTLMLQGIRRSDPQWLWMADVMARHHADICVYHTDVGAPAYRHGPFMHTTHETAAYRSTLRSYPIEAKRYGLRYGQGGGPNAGHTYVECLAHHYRLTGDRVSRDALLEVADWAADSPWFRPGMMADHRGFGNFLNTFVQAYQLTGNPKFYERAMTLIGWIEEPFEGLGGTLLAKAAGRFLQMKMDAEQLDDDFRRVQQLLMRLGDLYLSLPPSRWKGSIEQRCFHAEVLCTCYLYAPTDQNNRAKYYAAGRRILDEGLKDFPGHYVPVKTWVMCFANTGAYFRAGQVWQEEGRNEPRRHRGAE